MMYIYAVQINIYFQFQNAILKKSYIDKLLIEHFHFDHKVFKLPY